MKTPILLGFMLTSILSAAAEKDWTAWQWEAPLEVPQTGMIRLDLPPPVLDASLPDLRDLRVLSPTGAETPYRVDLPLHRAATSHDAAGFNVILEGNSTVIEVSPETSNPIEAVQLISPAREFLKSVSIEGRKAAGAWQPLATNQVIFRQASGVERLRLPLPAGAWESLRFSVNDDRSQPVPFTGVKLLAAAERPTTIELRAALGAREDAASETRLTLDLGARNLNLAEIRFEIPDAVFSRNCRLEFSSILPGAESRVEALSDGTIYRVLGEGDVKAEEVVIPVHRRVPARYLVATFRNGDSPPLTITGAGLRCYPTVLALHAAQPGTYRLLTGNRTAGMPDYDVNSTRGSLIPASGLHVSPGPLTTKRDFQTPQVLPGVDSPGTSIDLADWSRRRTVDFASTGAIQIELDPWALAGCRLDLGDLRLIQNGRQIPYLVKPDRLMRELTPALTLMPDDPKHPTVSHWELELPVDGLPVLELTASSPAPLFARRFEASIDRKDELGNAWTETIGTANWSKSAGLDSRLTLKLGGQRLPPKIRLQTDHGDNPAILLASPRLRFAAPVMVAKLTSDAPLFLVYGNPKAAPPQYDLQLVRKELMAAEPQTASLREEELLDPDKRAKLTVDSGSPWLWVALGGVVIALLVVVARLLPRQSDAQAAAP